MFRMSVTKLRRQSSKYLPPYVVGCRQESSEKSLSRDDAPTNGDTEDAKNDATKSTYDCNSKMIMRFVASNCDLRKIPPDIVKETITMQHIYLVDKTVAARFASLISPDLKKATTPVFEVFPGLGYLTEKLLEAGVLRIHLFETKSRFIDELSRLIEKYPDRLTVSCRDFFTLSKLTYSDTVNNTNVIRDVLQHVPKHKWNDKPSLYIIGTLTQKQFLYYLYHALTSGELSDHGRVALYLAMAPSISMLFDETIETTFRNPNHILLQLFYTHEILGTLPRRAFVPWLSKARWKNKLPRYNEDCDLLHVVKLVPKPDFFNDDFTKSDAVMLYHFLALNLRPISTRIIPALEKWIPNCGPRLIRMNFNVFTRFNQLSAADLLKLFKAFKSWPEYENCAFFGIVEDFKSRRLRR